VEQSPYFDAVVLAKNLRWEHFEPFIFRHTIVEASTAVKGELLRFLFKNYPEEDKFVYLDPDIKVYADFVELHSLLERHSLILAPHLLRHGNIDMEISSLAHGCYNLGFLALSRGENAGAFLDWWSERLFSYCYDDKAKGLFTDQRWADLAPCFFDAHILKHHGYDFATWSLLNCCLEELDGEIFVNGDPLRFIHFSGLDGGTVKWAVDQWLHDPNGKKIFECLYEEYMAEHNEHDVAGLSKIPWSYAVYDDGKPISKTARLIFREAGDTSGLINPFAAGEAAILALKKQENKHQISILVGKLFSCWKQWGMRETVKKIRDRLLKL
jgi:hypothetical protein